MDSSEPKAQTTYEYLTLVFDLMNRKAMDEELNDYGAGGWRWINSHVVSGRLFVVLIHATYPPKAERSRPAPR